MFLTKVHSTTLFAPIDSMLNWLTENDDCSKGCKTNSDEYQEE